METAFGQADGLAPHRGSLHCVLTATLDAVDNALSELDVRNEEERAQSARFIRCQDGRRHRAAHLLKRHLLGAATGQAPQDLCFDREPSGKPVLQQDHRPDFNLSHSGNWVIAAFSWTGRIGVDVEAQRPLPFWREIAVAFLTPVEMQSASGDQYLKLWTAKEAVLKAHGAGFAIMPNQITAAGDGDGFVSQVERLRLRGSWRWMDDNHLLAVAASNEVPHIAVCRDSGDLIAALEQVSQPVRGLSASR